MKRLFLMAVTIFGFLLGATPDMMNAKAFDKIETAQIGTSSRIFNYSGQWGTVSWKFDSSSGEIVFTSGGTLGIASESPWNRGLLGTGLLNSRQLIKKITITQPISAPEDSRALFTANSFGSNDALVNLEKIDNLNLLNTTNCSSMANMFFGDSKLKTLDLSNFKTNNVSNMSFMFSGTKGLTSLDLKTFDTSKVTNMNQMFYGSGVSTIDVSSFTTPLVGDMRYMFGETNLVDLNLSKFRLKNDNVDISYMFYKMSALKKLDISGFLLADNYSVSSFKLEGMFIDDVKLSSITLDKSFRSSITKLPLIGNPVYSGNWVLDQPEGEVVGDSNVFMAGTNRKISGTYVWQKKYDPTDPGQTSLVLRDVPRSLQFVARLHKSEDYDTAVSEEGLKNQSFSVYNDDKSRQWSIKASLVDPSFSLNGSANQKFPIKAFSINDVPLLGTGSSGIIMHSVSNQQAGLQKMDLKSSRASFATNGYSLKAGDALQTKVLYQLYDTVSPR